MITFFAEVRERFPCFDFFDYLNENRCYHWTYFTENGVLSLVYYEDEDEKVTVTEDVKEIEANVWREMMRLSWVKGGGWKQILGMDKAITIRFIKESSSMLRMEIGEAKWVDKGGIMLLSMFVLWPLTITSGIGMYKQGSLPGKIRGVADKYTETTSLESVQKEREKEKAKADLNKTVDKLAAEAPKVLPKIIDSLSKMIR